MKALSVSLIVACLAGIAQAEIDANLVKALKPSVVNIYVNTPVGLAGDTPGDWYGTGFIVDAKRGWIITNRHISGRSPATYRITFYNGDETNKARLLYYDPWQDFAILQLDTSTIRFALQPVEFGAENPIKEQQKVFSIGNSAGNNYTVLYGEVVNSIENPDINDDPSGDSHRHSSYFQVVYGQRGGSSGGPVFNREGKVIGIQCAGNDVTGDVLKASYLTDALSCLRRHEGSCRGDVGVVLDLMKISYAIDNFHLSESAAKQLRSILDAEGRSIKNVALVRTVIPYAPANGMLQPGDIIIKVGEMMIGDNLYAFDKEVDKSIGNSISIEVMRNGVPLTFRLPVQDAKDQRIRRYVTFAGGVFHDVIPEERRRFAIDGQGVVLNEIEIGSSMDTGGKYDKYPQWRQILIQAVNGVATTNLDAFIHEVEKLKDGDHIYMTVRDFVATNTFPRAVTIDLDFKDRPLKQYHFSDDTLTWE